MPVPVPVPVPVPRVCQRDRVHPALATAGPFSCLGLQVEFDPILHEPNVTRHRQCASDPRVIVLGNDEALNGLPGFEQFPLDEARSPAWRPQALSVTPAQGYDFAC